MKPRSLLVAMGLGLLALTPSLRAKPAMGRRMMPRPAVALGDGHFREDFKLLATNPRMHRSVLPSTANATGTSIAALQGGTVVIDDETGTLSLLDGGSKVVDTLKVGDVAGLLVVDTRKKQIYVADRKGDRIVVVSYGQTLQTTAAFATRAEPFGLALTPDRKTLLVTTVAGKSLQAFDTKSQKEVWHLELGPEARAVAVAPDGKDAVVSFLGTGAIARVDLVGKASIRFEALAAPPVPSTLASRRTKGFNRALPVPKRYARNAFAATFVGNTAVVAYQQSTPLAISDEGRESRGTYGGSADGNPPILHRLAFLPRSWQAPGRAHLRVQIPRSLTYDARTDSLLIADMGNDEVVVIGHASSPAIQQSRRITLQRKGHRCGPNGIAVTDSGDILVNCSFEKKVARIVNVEGSDVLPRQAAVDAPTSEIQWSEPLSTSPLTAAAQRGRALFHQGNDARLSMSGALACANCHAEARTDGLSWRIEGTELQTPLLAGRLLGTHPFKWDGQDKDLRTSLMNTTVRLGGSGIPEETAKDLQAYLESLPAIRSNTTTNLKVLASQERGKTLFDSESVGCSGCHSGSNYSDGKSYEFSDDINHVNTPSLLGLAASAPYYHDGSAASLRDLVMENGSVHGMGDMSALKAVEVQDLVAFLETL